MPTIVSVILWIISCFWSCVEHTLDQLHLHHRHDVLLCCWLVRAACTDPLASSRESAGVPLASRLAVACKHGDDAGDVELLVRVLGPLEVWRAGAVVPIGGPKARLTLAVLLAHRSSVVSVDRLADALWGDCPPASAVATIQSNVSRLRKALAPDVDIVARAPGYVLEAPTDSRRRGAVRRPRARRERAPTRRRQSSTCSGARWRCGGARRSTSSPTWSGPAAKRCDSKSFVWSRSENLIDARLALGESRPVVGELERLVVDHPLRERFWRQLMVALYRSGRQAEALRQANQLRVLPRRGAGARSLACDARARTADPGRRSHAVGRGRPVGRRRDQ